MLNSKILKYFIIFLLAGAGLVFFSFAIFSPSVVDNRKSAQVGENSQVSGAKIPESNLLESPTNEDTLRESTKVRRVIDGDTIEIEGGQRVRYIGIDTPETVHPQKPVECFGQEASAKNRELVEGKTVMLEKDVSETDKYGRLLRYVFVGDLLTSSGQVFVNDFLVRQGYAYASTYPPDVKYQGQLTGAQQEAQQTNRGLWSLCQGANQSGFIEPQPSQENCIIKGNISSLGEKIYHMPGQKYYDKTVIDKSKGERWFCSEEEAVAAGWRKSKI